MNVGDLIWFYPSLRSSGKPPVIGTITHVRLSQIAVRYDGVTYTIAKCEDIVPATKDEAIQWLLER